jgi:hypothetical protein
MTCVHLLVLRFVVLQALARLKDGSGWPFVWRSRIAIPAFLSCYCRCDPPMRVFIRIITELHRATK